MRLVNKWRARSLIDGLPVTIRRAQFNTQRDQVKFLRQLVDAYRATYTIIQLARDIVFRQRQCPPKAKACHALAIADWVQQHVTYVNEGEEQFQTPLHTLRVRYGDCDDFTTLIASLCEAIGIPVELVALGWRQDGLPYGKGNDGAWLQVFRQDTYRHIFPRAVIAKAGRPTVRIPLDATLDRPVARRTDPIAMARSRGLTPHTLVL